MKKRLREHEFKCWPEPFQAKWDGLKTHEIRKDDRGGFEVGDVLVEREWIPCVSCAGGTVNHRGPCPGCNGAGTKEGYTGREIREVVTYITWADTFGLPRGLVVMSTRTLDREDRS